MEAYPVPWLARHGAWVWVGALVAMVLAGGLYSWLPALVRRDSAVILFVLDSVY